MRDNFTKEERRFLEPYEAEFLTKHKNAKHKDKDVADFKERAYKAFIEHFGLTENLDLARQRVYRRFSNVKHDAKAQEHLDSQGSLGDIVVDKKSSKTIAEFFQHVQTRKLSGRDVWARENKDQASAMVANDSSKKSSDGSRRGLHNRAKSDLYESLPDDVREEYDQRAAEENAAKIEGLKSTLDDAAVIRNQQELQSVMLNILSSLPGRKNSYSVGDAVFFLNMAYVSPTDGSVVTESVYTFHGDVSFKDCDRYDQCRKIWSKFSKKVLGRHRDEGRSLQTAIDVDASETLSVIPPETPADKISRASVPAAALKPSSASAPIRATTDLKRSDSYPDRGLEKTRSLKSRPEVSSSMSSSSPIEHATSDVFSCRVSSSMELSPGLTYETQETDPLMSPLPLVISSPLPVTAALPNTPGESVTGADPEDEPATREDSIILRDKSPFIPYAAKRRNTDSQAARQPSTKRRKRCVPAPNVEPACRSHRKVVRPRRPDADVPTPDKKRSRAKHNRK